MCVWYAYTGRTVNYSPHVFDQSSNNGFIIVELAHLDQNTQLSCC